MAIVTNVLVYRVPTNSQPLHESSTSTEGTIGDVYLPKYETLSESIDKRKKIKDFSSFIPFPEVLQHQNVATCMLLWAVRCKLQAYYLDGTCRVRPCSPVANRWICNSKEMDRTDRTQTSRETITIDLIKSVQIGATNSQLLQCMDPPLGSDLHYDDK